jgi:hypothetical protein
MFFAILNSTSNGYCSTFSANKLFLLEILIIVLSGFTIFHASEVWNLAFEAHVV